MNRRTPELDAVLERIHKKLIAKHVLLGEPATLQKLRAFESSYRVSLPSEFRHFLLKIGRRKSLRSPSRLKTNGSGNLKRNLLMTFRRSKTAPFHS